MPVLIDKLSVFFPAYNEEANLEKTVGKAKGILEEIAGEWEILIINDGSKDRTGEIAENLAKKDPRIKVITHSPNRGYGASLKSGFYNSRYPWIAFTDSDGQFDFAEITNFIKTQKETNADLVVGYYRKRRVSLFRKINTFLWELIVFLLFGLKVRDIDCGFKFISKKVIDTIPKLKSERGAFISSEFLIKTKRAGFSMVEIPVSHFPATRKGTGANLNVIIKSFVDLFRLWRKLR
jgi:glycosyltransferase involved in cell wall biosynthesis